MEPLVVSSSKHARRRAAKAAKAAKAVSTPHGGQYEPSSDDRGGSSKGNNDLGGSSKKYPNESSDDDGGGSSKYTNETSYDILRAHLLDILSVHSFEEVHDALWSLVDERAPAAVPDISPLAE
jgi:hypothetical protein